jgi:hypothetical protein
MRRYLDPVELVWLATARRLGLVVRRRPDVFASTDGRGTLLLGTRETLDPDDHLAQMVLHEIGHWIVNGAGAEGEIDWGFPPMEGLDWREWPTLRLQAWLAERHGLRTLLAPTTDARAYWDRLGDPLVPLDDSPEEARIVARTREAVAASGRAPFQPALDEALAATARLAGIVRPFAPAGTLWAAR